MTAHRFPDGVAVGPDLDITEDTGLLVTKDPTTGLLVAQTVHREILQEMVGATTGPDAAGIRGAVPQPGIGDHNKLLRGDGTWGAVPAGQGPPKVFADVEIGSGDVSTTSDVYVDLPGMSVTLNTSGVDVRVAVWFSCDFEISKQNRSALFQVVHVDGGTLVETPILDSERQLQLASNNSSTLGATQTVTNAADGDIVKVQYRRDVGQTVTVTVGTRNLIALGYPLTEIA